MDFIKFLKNFLDEQSRTLLEKENLATMWELLLRFELDNR